MGPADWWVPPAAGLLVDRPAPLPRVLSAAAYCSLVPDDEGFVEVSVATVCRLEGSHCSLTSSCLLNVAHVSREGGSRLLGAGYALGRLGEAGPPSRTSLAIGARRPWAVLASVVGDVEASMATVPSRTGDGRPVRRPVAMPVPGFGGSGLHWGHAPSYHRYVGAALVGAVLAGFGESAFFMVSFWESVLLGPASWCRPSRNSLREGF